jgi:hypothetical protein
MIQIAAEYGSTNVQVVDADVDVSRLDLGSGKSLAGTPAAMAYLEAKQSNDKVPEGSSQ